MVASLVGYQGVGKAGATTPWADNSWALTNGSASSPSPGDVCLLVANAANAVNYTWPDPLGTGISAGYTRLFDLYANDTRDTNLGVYYRVQGASVDSGWPMPYSNSAAAGSAAAIIVFRDVDPVNIFDVTSLSATGTNTGIPTAPTINSAGGALQWCVSLVGGTGAVASPVNYTNSQAAYLAAATGNGSTYDAHVAISASFNNNWSGGIFANGPGTSTSNSWAAVSLVLRSATGRVKYWNGSSFAKKPVKVWNGSAWVTKPAKTWTGSAWRTTQV